MIVNLTIEGDYVPIRARCHGLMTGRGQINDGKTPMPQGNARGAVHPHALVVGPAMNQPFSQRGNELLRRLRLQSRGIPEAG